LNLRYGDQTMALSLHSLVIARSPKLRSLIATSGANVTEPGIKHIMLDLTDSFVGVPALISAIRVCYGASASASHYTSGFLAPPQADDRGQLSMEMCLQYLAAGNLLQLQNVMHVGVESACHMLSFESLENFMAFGLHGSLASPEPSNREGLVATSNNGTTFAPYADQIIGTAVHYVSPRLHGGFVFDQAAPSSEKLGGFPNLQEIPDIGHKRMSSNPRLSFIQFGELHSPSDPHTTRLSTILLSVPFEILAHILASIVRPQLTSAVIAERERRRLSYLKRNNFQANGHGGAYHLHPKANWEEGIDVSGVRITRQWRAG